VNMNVKNKRILTVGNNCIWLNIVLCVLYFAVSCFTFSLYDWVYGHFTPLYALIPGLLYVLYVLYLLFIRKKKVGFIWFLICVNGIYLLSRFLIQYRNINILSIDTIAQLSYLLDLPILCVGKIAEKIVNNDYHIIMSIIIEGILVFGMSN
jgi:hypothetical protein